MIGSTGALIIALMNLAVGCVIGLLVSGLILRKRLTFLRGLGISLVSSVAFLSGIAWLNCNSFQNGVCVDASSSNLHNQLVAHTMLSASLLAVIVSLLLSLCLRALAQGKH